MIALVSEWVKFNAPFLTVDDRFQEKFKRSSIHFPRLGCAMHFHLPKAFTIISSVNFVGWTHVSTVTLTPAFFPMKLILAQSITRLPFFNVQISPCESFPTGGFVNATRRKTYCFSYNLSQVNVLFLQTLKSLSKPKVFWRFKGV